MCFDEECGLMIVSQNFLNFSEILDKRFARHCFVFIIVIKILKKENP